MKQKIIFVMGLLLALLMPGILPGGQALAGEAPIGFYVKALLPENQIDLGLTYFDLRMGPEQVQTLEVMVVNESGEAIDVDVAAISASTNRNGVIDYKTPDIQDITLVHPFSGLARVEETTLTIPAGESALARITITMPEDSFDGVVLGSLVFTRQPELTDETSQGVRLQNQYSYVIGVQLRETDAPVAPDFELEGVRGETVNYRSALLHNIRNKNAAIAKGVDLHVAVRNAQGQIVGKITRTGIDMAPNSILPLAVTPEDAQLTPGAYTSDITLEHDGQTWELHETFTVGQEEARDINAQGIGPAAQNGPQGQPSTWLILLLGASGAVILALCIVILLMLRRKKREQESARQMGETKPLPRLNEMLETREK